MLLINVQYHVAIQEIYDGKWERQNPKMMANFYRDFTLFYKQRKIHLTLIH